MLSARAYSFRQKSRLAISLSWVGGYTNVVALLACGTFVSHVTGTTTNLGHDLVSHDFYSARFFAFLWITFLGGAAASAVMTETARRAGLSSRYSRPMALEAVLLTLFGFGLHVYQPIQWGQGFIAYGMAGLASFAMGLQNATITKISGAVVRTTHLTGVTTDLGLEGVQFLFWLRDRFRGRGWNRAQRMLRITRRHPDFLRVLLLASIWGSFLFGVMVGTVMFNRWSAGALVLPVCFLIFIIFQAWRAPIADVREIDPMADSEMRLAGIVKSLLPPEMGIWRVSCKQHRVWHQPPDFQSWIDRVPERWRVIILALSPMTRFDANSLLDLDGAIRKLRADSRWLILAGITPAQYHALATGGITHLLEPENVCTDLEFAIARGIDLAQQLPDSPMEPAA